MTEKRFHQHHKVSKRRESRGWSRLFLVMSRKGQEETGRNWRKFCLNMRKNFFTEWLHARAHCLECGVLLSGNIPESSRCIPVPGALGWLCWSREVGTGNPLWSLPTRPFCVILWFCESLPFATRLESPNRFSQHQYTILILFHPPVLIQDHSKARI